MYKLLYLVFSQITHFFRYFKRKSQIAMLKECGVDTHIENGCSMNWEHVSLGNDVHIGENNHFLCSRSYIKIGDHVMFGPNVTFITGNHRYDIVGKYMTQVTEAEKKDEDDGPIILEGDNWIGANSTVLKGVTIGEGAIVAAGALVNKNVPPFSIVGGVPARIIGYRFSPEDIKKHKAILRSNKG